MTDNPYVFPDSVEGTTAPKKKHGSILLKLLLGVGIVLELIALLLPAVRIAGPSARRLQCRNNLRQIGLALLNYKDAHGAFPPAYTFYSLTAMFDLCQKVFPSPIVWR